MISFRINEKGTVIKVIYDVKQNLQKYMKTKKKT